MNTKPNKVKSILKLIRVKQYVKNALIFLPLFFSGSVLDVPLLIKTAIGFVAFSLVASVVYIINDLSDIEKDRKHPKKRFRPLASGAIIPKQAYVILGVISLVIVGIAFTLPVWGVAVLALYLGINIAYSTRLKHAPLVDVAIVAAGFYLRLVFGGVVSDIELSTYITLTVLFVALFMAFGKRRNELVQNGANSRKVLKYYSKDFLDKNMYVMVALSIVFYALWATSITPTNTLISATIPLVIFLMIRYSYNIEKDSSDGDPSEVLLSDRVILLLGAVFAAVLTLGIYAS